MLLEVTLLGRKTVQLVNCLPYKDEAFEFDQKLWGEPMLKTTDLGRCAQWYSRGMAVIK